MIGNCQDIQDLDLCPRWFNLPAIKAQVICSPEDNKTSYSALSNLLLSFFDLSIRSLVVPLIAEETTIILNLFFL